MGTSKAVPVSGRNVFRAWQATRERRDPSGPDDMGLICVRARELSLHRSCGAPLKAAKHPCEPGVIRVTVRVLSGLPNRETRNAEQFRDLLLASEPELEHPDITAEIFCGLFLPGRELDLVMIYHDPREKKLQLKTPQGTSIHSFVLVVEVKQHSPDLIRFEGPSVRVRYDGEWSNATQQCDEQTWALKRYQEGTYKGSRARETTFVQRAIWLARAPMSAFDGKPAESSVPVHFKDLTWHDLVARFVTNGDQVRTLVDHADHAKYHSIETLHALFTHEVRPTRLDLRRVNALTQTRFDAEKTAYIQNLGSGLLMLRGRGGTGKTFALMQIALHIARQGKRTVLLTYNHGLIADISRALRFIAEKEPSLLPLPKIQTRYAFLREVFTTTFGSAAEEIVKNHIGSIEDRESFRLKGLSKGKAFLDEVIPGQCSSSQRHKCRACRFPDAPKNWRWKDVAIPYEGVVSSHDFVFIDEGQDWTEEQRDLIFEIFSPENVVVADGVNQFVGQDRCNWDRGDIPINRRHGLRASRRTKAATCQTVAEIANDLGLSDWDLEPDPDAQGGRFTVIVERDPRRAVERGLEVLENDQLRDSALKAVDNLVCLPAAAMAKGVNYSWMFDGAVDAKSRDSWRGFDDDARRIYPLRTAQLRAVQYSSCRGMEGWTTLCLGLDVFFDFQAAHPRIDVERFEFDLREREGLLFSQEKLDLALAEEARLFAINWLMIPLTRSIDHLVVHLADQHSELGKILQRVRERQPGSIEWIEG